MAPSFWRPSLLRRRVLPFGGVLLLGWLIWFLSPGTEVYRTCREVAPYFGEDLELSRGSFSYWSYSDAGGDSDPGPISGSYVVEGNRLVLSHPSFIEGSQVRFQDRLGGVPVLWRKDGWELWQEKGQIHPYGVLIRADRPLLPFLRPHRPSLSKISSR